MIPANKIISIHAPAKGATPKVHSILLVWRISIHAPAKGATNVNGWHSCSVKISIHAPAKGATYRACFLHACHRSFQSTLPRRERLWQGFRAAMDDTISIHAPAKGATFTPLF